MVQPSRPLRHGEGAPGILPSISSLPAYPSSDGNPEFVQPYMLTLQFSGYTKAAAPVWTCRGQVWRTEGGRLANYRSRLFDEADSEVAAGRVEGYPRWAEPHALLAARAIRSALPTLDESLEALRGAFRFSMSVYIRGDLLSRTPGALFDNQLKLTQDRQFDLPAEPLSRWALAAHILLAEWSGSLHLPSMPEPVETSVYELNGVRYCRVVDLPREGAQVYEVVHRGSGKPSGPGIPADAVFPWDIDAFLGD